MSSAREVVVNIILVEYLDKKDPCISLKDYIDSNYREQSLLMKDDPNLVMMEYKKFKKENSAKRQKTKNVYGKDSLIIEERTNLYDMRLLNGNVEEGESVQERTNPCGNRRLLIDNVDENTDIVDEIINDNRVWNLNESDVIFDGTKKHVIGG